MRLSDWMEKHDYSPSLFAARIGVTYESVRRYCTGERIPRSAPMQKIVALTKGKVTARDFHEQAVEKL